MNRAKKVCNRCPVITECLAYALDRMNDGPEGSDVYGIGMHGVWGGTTPQERWRLVGRRPSEWAS